VAPATSAVSAPPLVVGVRINGFSTPAFTFARHVLPVGRFVDLRVVNRDALRHDLTFERNGSVWKKTRYLPLGQNGRIVLRFAKPGIYAYYCSLHVGAMSGSIRVR